MSVALEESELEGLAPEKIVDARGSACPGPLLEAKKGIGSVPSGASSRSGRAIPRRRATSRPGRARSAMGSSATGRRTHDRVFIRRTK